MKTRTGQKMGKSKKTRIAGNLELMGEGEICFGDGPLPDVRSWGRGESGAT